MSILNASSSANSSPIENTKPKKKKIKLQMKSPTQERSRQTVSTILSACARIIVREGYFGVTTDKIAKEAGVSIGSLYQFFGNKESVVSAVIVDLFDKDMILFQERLKQMESIHQDQKLTLLFEIGLEVYSTEVELRSKIQNVYQYLVDQSYYANLMKSYQDLFAKYIPHSPQRDPQVMAYLCVHGFIGMMEIIVQDNKNFREDKKLTSEIIKLFTGYLNTDKI